jgi:succinate dehydrogenase flavin-adding protein (antitoxin of CptAB toxin-antitoxin module)
LPGIITPSKTMKKHLLAAAGIALLLGCTDTKKQEKDLLNQVIAVHDKVMANDEQLMKNKMLLDSLVKHNAPNINKDTAQVYLKLVDDADNAMSDWMHKFDAENKGKSHQEIMDYLDVQKKLINKIDTQINEAVTGSTKYINQIPAK